MITPETRRPGSPLLDLVRLTRVLRLGEGSASVGVGVVAAAEEVPVLTGAVGRDGLAVGVRCPWRSRVVPARGCPPGELAVALREVLRGPSRVLVVASSARVGPRSHRVALTAALDAAAGRGVPVFAAAGTTRCAVTAHPWVVPVYSCSVTGRPSWFVEWAEDSEEPVEGFEEDPVGGDPEAAPRGLLAPGQEVPGPHGRATGNGVAAAVVAATAALLWSLAPSVPGSVLRSALLVGATTPRRWAPPLLDAQRAWEFVTRGVA
ncbi:hypothetical protein [Actinokineospora spheciospongiae]|uniref:hypothetical protein n=1 Tax=Actinokineospora spheciospongiae TaxID=909613 RepID=UPI0011B668CF|nr:hypothetical protein [Actinokineospora spheciospongiae]